MSFIRSCRSVVGAGGVQVDARICATSAPLSSLVRASVNPIASGSISMASQLARCPVLPHSRSCPQLTPRSVIVLDKETPFDVAALVGCGVVTGWGAAVNSAQVRSGDVVIVMGTGGVGVNAVQGAALSGAGEVIAVDPVEFKRKTALAVGATSAFASIDEATAYAQSITDGQGADSTIVTIGVTTGEHIAQGFESVRKGGTLVVTGVGNHDDAHIPINGAVLASYQKRIQGSLFGEGNPLVDIPRVIRLAALGKIKVSDLITKRYALDEIARGYEDMHGGHNIRGLIDFS